MKIRQLHLKNIGPFDDETIEFQPCPAQNKAEIHIFTGPNGSGKTTLLMALACAFENDGWEPKFDIYTSHYEPSYLFNGFQKRLRALGKVEVVFQDQNNPSSVEKDKKGNIFMAGSPTISYSRLVKANGRDFDLEFAVFAFSGYRQIVSERVEAIYEPKEFKPLAQSLEFVKDYSQANQISINQLIANNFSKKWIESSRNPEKSKKFARVLASVEQAIFDITGWKIEFDLQTEPTNLIVKFNGEELELDVLPDGLRSLMSWIADLLCRVDLLKWADDAPITEKQLILFLDEIEVHLHPSWQRKVLPVVQKLFKNSQIFISTHSPFVVNSVDDARVYDLEIDGKGKAHIAQVTTSSTSQSVETVLRKIFDVDEKFGLETQNKLEDFYRQKEAILHREKTNKTAFLKLAKQLALKGAENGDSLLRSIILSELKQLNRITGSSEFEI